MGKERDHFAIHRGDFSTRSNIQRNIRGCFDISRRTRNHCSSVLQHKTASMYLWFAVVLLLAASASASHVRTNYIVDKVLSGAGDVMELRDISFDIDNQAWTFAGYVEVHMEKGTLGNMRRRVRRSGDCSFSDRRNVSGYRTTPHFTLTCRLSLRGLVARYTVEVIADDRTQKMAAEFLVDNGSVYMIFETRFENCSNISCTHLYRWDLDSVSTKLKPIKTNMDPWMNTYGLVPKLESLAQSRVHAEIVHELSTTYLRAVSDQMIPLKAYMFSDEEQKKFRKRR